jgi:hypothetical protein
LEGIYHIKGIPRMETILALQVLVEVIGVFKGHRFIGFLYCAQEPFHFVDDLLLEVVLPDDPHFLLPGEG